MSIDRVDHVVIDDERTFTFDAVHLRTSCAAIAHLEALADRHTVIGTLWLDHDLGGDDTISAVVDWLCERCVWDRPLAIDQIHAHTSNPYGGDMIVRTLRRWYQVRRIDPLPYLASRC